jgi:hypothetical protein
MLYNPHREVPSLESFAAWLDTKPADEQYHWVDTLKCPCAQYAVAFDLSKQWLQADHSLIKDDEPIWCRLNYLAWDAATKGIRVGTFGALREIVHDAIIAQLSCPQSFQAAVDSPRTNRD